MINSISQNQNALSFKGTVNIDKMAAAKGIALFPNKEQQDGIIKNIKFLKTRLEEETSPDCTYYFFLKPKKNCENVSYLNIMLIDDENNIYKSGINMSGLKGNKTDYIENSIYEFGFKDVIENAIWNDKKRTNRNSQQNQNPEYQKNVEEIHKKLDILL